MMNPGDISKCPFSFLEEWEIYKAYLFGSYSRGEAHENSDIDIILQADEDIFLCGDFIEAIQDVLKKSVSIADYYDIIKLENFKDVEKDMILIFPYFDEDKKICPSEENKRLRLRDKLCNIIQTMDDIRDSYNLNITSDNHSGAFLLYFQWLANMIKHLPDKLLLSDSNCDWQIMREWTDRIEP